MKLDPENPDYNYEIGLAIFEEKVNRGKAAPYLTKAIQNTVSDTLPDMFLYAAKAEQFAGNFDMAIDNFKIYMRLMRETAGLAPNELEEDIPRYIEMCENGKVQFENNKKYIRIDNMGNQINSVYADYAPVEEVIEEVVEPIVVEEPVVEEPVIQEMVVEETIEEKPEVEEIAQPSTPIEEEKIVFRNILFDFDRSFLREESKVELNKISDYMDKKNSVELRIDGHADWIGTPA